MRLVQATLTIDTDNLPPDFPEILKQEQEVVARWRQEGLLEHLFLRPERNGAVLLFKGLTQEEVRAHMETLPFFKISKSIAYLELLKQF